MYSSSAPRRVNGRYAACGMTFHDVQRRLDTMLREAGCQRYSGRQALADAAECWREVRDDDIAHGVLVEEPFFNFVATEGVGVFAMYGSGVEFYVVPGEEPDLRRRFEPLAMTEVEAARAILAAEFGRPAADLSIEASLSRAWLLASGGPGAR